MDMEEESQFLDQSATISRVEQMLRAYHPSSAPNNGTSAVALSVSAGVSTKYDEWGSDITVEADYAGPHVKWPLTLENVQKVRPRLASLPPQESCSGCPPSCLRFFVWFLFPWCPCSRCFWDGMQRVRTG